MQSFNSRARLIYLILIPVTIATGLLARMNKGLFPDIINLVLGDALYSVMIYFIVSFLLPQKNFRYKAIIALLFCYLIELLQLYQDKWITDLRATLPGKLVLGSGFLWTDLVAYLIGVFFAVAIDKFCVRSREIRP